MGFNAASITKIIGNGGGSKNLVALQKLLTIVDGEKTQLQVLIDLGLNVESLIKIIANIGGSKNLAALQKLLTIVDGEKTQLQVLIDLGFNAASITKIIANSVVYLASDQASYLNGSEIRLDGGGSAGYFSF